MNREEAKALAAELVRLEPGAAFAAGLNILRADYPDLLLPSAKRLSDRHRLDARMAQLHGLAARALSEGPTALAAFARAARLAPADPLIAHSHARAALEAGKPAVVLFLRAAGMAPRDGSVVLGLASARVAEGAAQDAIHHLNAALAGNPQWLEGHRSLAHIRGQLGLDPLTAIDTALAANGQSIGLHQLRLSILLEARRLHDMPAAVAAARAALGDSAWLARIDAHQASERGLIDEADVLFGALAQASTSAEIAFEARHGLRAGRPAQAAALLEPHLGRGEDHKLWPYLSLAWRQTGDPRFEWLEVDPALVGVYDIADRAGDLGQLANHLRALHFATEAPLDQSVRGGTQTDGNLFLRDEAPIQRLRAAILETVAEYVGRLAPPRDGHPTLIARRTPLRISGSWSVRLRDAGFHTDHVHSQGWISSAFYVALPDNGIAPSDRHNGWLSLGENRDLVPDLAPLRMVEPRPGRLVLFPSTMWHGTRPFASGERLTAAFDIARPKQS